MKATMANAIRTIDALRIKKEDGSPVAEVAAVVEAPVAEVAAVEADAAVEAVVETPEVTEEVQAPVAAIEEEKE